MLLARNDRGCFVGKESHRMCGWHGIIEIDLSGACIRAISLFFISITIRLYASNLQKQLVRKHRDCVVGKEFIKKNCCCCV